MRSHIAGLPSPLCRQCKLRALIEGYCRVSRENESGIWLAEPTFVTPTLGLDRSTFDEDHPFVGRVYRIEKVESDTCWPVGRVGDYKQEISRARLWILLRATDHGHADVTRR